MLNPVDSDPRVSKYIYRSPASSVFSDASSTLQTAVHLLIRHFAFSARPAEMSCGDVGSEVPGRELGEKGMSEGHLP